MNKLKTFLQFFNENIFTADANTPDEIKNKINRINTLDGWIKEFPSLKNQISEIYLKSVTPNDQENKLKPFMENPGTKDSKFKNELLGLWAEVCSLNKKIQNLDKDINTKKEEISQAEESMKSSEGDAKETYKENIDLTKGKITNLESEKNNLMSQILSKKKESDEQLKNFKSELEQYTKEIRFYNEQKLKKM